LPFVAIPGNETPQGAEEHWLEGRGGVKVRVLIAPAAAGAPRGSVIVSPGRTEFIEKYFEVIRELQARGFSVFCIDWRGQGLSGRETGNPLKGHIVSFDDPVNDLATALSLFADRLPKPHIGLAHSMGGGDATEGFVQPGALAHVTIPILVASAEQECLVDNASHEAVAAQLPNARHITIPAAKHEILMEQDAARLQFWAAFDELAAQVSPATVAAT